MNAAALSARMRRLDQIAVGLARETQLLAQSDIFLYRERREYLDALLKMRYALESARVVLARARRRIER